MFRDVLVNPFDEEPRDIGGWIFLLAVTLVISLWPEVFLYKFLGSTDPTTIVPYLGMELWILELLFPPLLAFGGLWISAGMRARRKNSRK